MTTNPLDANPIKSIDISHVTWPESQVGGDKPYARRPHTPTPWQYTTNVGPTKALIVERDGSTVMEVRRTVGDGFPTNVAFVIHACNAHDDLVAALLEIRDTTGDHTSANIARAVLAKAEA